MKKITLSVVMIFLATAAWSQVSFGVKAGVNIAKENFKQSGLSLNPSNMVGFHGGVFMTARFGKFGIQPEVLYSMAGSKIESSGFTVEDKTTYLSIPILFRYNVVEVFHLDAGPQFGVLMSAKGTVNGTTDDIKDQYKSGDFGLAFGAGIDLPMGFTGGARYVAGLSDIDKDTSDDLKVKNNIIQIYVGWKFGGK